MEVTVTIKVEIDEAKMIEQSRRANNQGRTSWPAAVQLEHAVSDAVRHHEIVREGAPIEITSATIVTH